MDVSDRRRQVRLTQEAKIASDFSLIRAIFAFAGFISALGGGRICVRRFLRAGRVFPANSAMGISPALPIQMPRPSSRKMSVPRPVAPPVPMAGAQHRPMAFPAAAIQGRSKTRPPPARAVRRPNIQSGKIPLPGASLPLAISPVFNRSKPTGKGASFQRGKSLTFYMASPPLRVSPPPRAILRRSSPPPGR